MEVQSLPSLAGSRVAVLGKLAGMTVRETASRIEAAGGEVVPVEDAAADWVVLGEDALPLSPNDEEHLAELLAGGEVRVVSESQLWERLGIVEGDLLVRKLYTPAMLADLLGVPVAVIRRWRRRGLIVPLREVRRLAYYDYQQVATARRLAELLAAGMSPARIEQQLAGLRKLVPDVQRPLEQLSVIVEGKHILLRQGDGLIDAGGQMRFDFDAPAAEAGQSQWKATTVPMPPGEDAGEATSQPHSWDELAELAAELEDEGSLGEAEQAYRAALAAGGPRAEVCFQLAEVLYRRGDLPAARERYYMAVEMDADYVEARANLGCVLSELGQHELAAAAFQGALKYHEQFPDAHYHLARTLEQLGRSAEASEHWRSFLELAPQSPWAEEARLATEGAPTEA